MAVVCLVQTSGGGGPDSAEPSGELRSAWGSADQAGNTHHPPLRRRPGRLANPTEEPARHGGVGGKCSGAINILGPVLKKPVANEKQDFTPSKKKKTSHLRGAAAR